MIVNLGAKEGTCAATVTVENLHASSRPSPVSIGCKASGFRLEAARVGQNLNASLLAKASAPLNASSAEIKALHELPVGGRRSCPRTAELGLRQVLAAKRLMNLRSEVWARWTYSW